MSPQAGAANECNPAQMTAENTASGIVLFVQNDNSHSTADISNVSIAGLTTNMVVSRKNAEPSKTGLLPSSMTPSAAKITAITAEGTRLVIPMRTTYLRIETLVSGKNKGVTPYF